MNKQDNHSFEEISKVMVSNNKERVINWCSDCGAIKMGYKLHGKIVECEEIKIPKNYYNST